MFNVIKKFVTANSEKESESTEENKSQKIMVAACALLLEIANIDGEFSEAERDNIVSIIKNSFQLSDKDTDELIDAANEELKGSIDLWHFTNLINQNYSQEEKIRIIEMLWEVVYADEILDKHEDYLIHKLADLLRLSHKELIEAKLKVKKSSI